MKFIVEISDYEGSGEWCKIIKEEDIDPYEAYLRNNKIGLLLELCNVNYYDMNLKLDCVKLIYAYNAQFLAEILVSVLSKEDTIRTMCSYLKSLLALLKDKNLFKNVVLNPRKINVRDTSCATKKECIRSLFKYIISNYSWYITQDRLNLFDKYICFIYERIISYSKDNVYYISSTIEMYYIIKLCLFYNHLLRMFVNSEQISFLKINTIFNLPPGAGKTYQCALLNAELEDLMKICCPTAKACLLYNNASTCHSFFNIDYNNKNNISEKYGKVNLIRKIGGPKLILFDEFSMISIHILKNILSYMNNNSINSYVCLVGDSAQLLPVRAPAILDSNSRHEKELERFGFVEFEFNSEAAQLRIPRFLGNIKFQSFILNLKNIIDNIHNGFTIDLQFLNYIETSFLMLFNVHNIDYGLVLKKLINTQLYNVQQLFRLKTSISDNESAAPASENNILEQHIQALEKLQTNTNTDDVFRKASIAVGYTNKYCLKIQESIYNECGDFFSNMNNTLLYSIFVEESAYKDVNIQKKIDKYIFNLPGSVGNINSHLLIGSSIMCRKNSPEFINGQSAYIVHYYETGGQSNVKNVKTIQDKNNSIAIRFIENLETFYPKFIIYDFDKQQLVELNPISIKMCKDCDKRDCNHAIHTLLKIFFWHTNYAITTHNLQGVTLLNEELFLESKEVLQSHKLRVAYTILSRVVDPKQVHIDQDFIDQVLVAIFPSQKNFIKKQKLGKK